jgi:hypothetical protein
MIHVVTNPTPPGSDATSLLLGMQPAKQEHHKAMIGAFRGYIDVGKDNPVVGAVQVESS